jgi:glycosyltransferase involved in cell wall biosynthesis
MTIPKRPARVCFLIDELAAAGTETQLLALIRHVNHERVLPHLVLLRGESQSSRALEPDCCPVLRLGVGSLKSPTTAVRAWRFAQFLWRQRIDVVQAYFPDSSYFGVTTAFLAGVPHRVRTRNNVGHWLTAAHRILGRALNLFTTATVANCGAARDALLRDERPSPASVVVLANGVDLDRFLSLQPPSVQSNVVGAVSNLRPVKGLDVLVEAAARLKTDFPGVTYRVAGEGEQRGELQARIDAAGLHERFHLCGSQKDVPAFLGSLGVAVLASRAEGMSNAVLEYLAAARPVVATAVGATPELLRQGECGLLVPPEDPGAMAAAIARLLKDRPLAARLAHAGRQRAVNEYSRAAMVRRFEDFYARLIHDRTQPRDAPLAAA